MDDRIVAMLPYSVIVIEKSENKIEVAAVDPVVSMRAVENDLLSDLILEIKSKSKREINSL